MSSGAYKLVIIGRSLIEKMKKKVSSARPIMQVNAKSLQKTLMNMLRILSVCFVFLLTQQKATSEQPNDHTDALEHISTYLDKLDNVAGTFLQIDQQGNTSTGQFLMKHPADAV